MRTRITVLFVIMFATLGASYLLKHPCLTTPWGKPGNIQYTHACYNDLQPLYGLRGLDHHLIPYVEARPFEYPPVIALQLWATSYLAKTNTEFFNANAILLAAAATLTLVALMGMIGPHGRILWFVAGSPLLAYAFYNLDLLAVAPLALAMWSWRRRRHLATGAFLGIGTAAKLFPGFALPALLVATFRNPKRPQAFSRLALGFLGAWLALNLPFLIGDWLTNDSIQGWLSMFSFHAKRYPDYGTFWHWLNPVSRHYKLFVDRMSFLLFGAGTMALLITQVLYRIKPWSVAAGVVALFLLVNKVHSPQYTLWLVPFFVVTHTPNALILAYFFADALLFGGSMALLSELPSLNQAALHRLFGFSVFLRSGILIALIAHYARPKRRLVEEELVARNLQKGPSCQSSSQSTRL